MHPLSIPVDTLVATEGFSRRSVLGASATGLAFALLARSFSQAAAQEATPAAEGGMPEGVTFTALSSVPASDLPSGDVLISLARATLEPGASVPVSTFPYPGLGYVEAGTLTCPGEAGRYIVGADGAVREVGDEEATVNTGEAIYVPANVGDGARNDGTDQLVILLVEFPPAEEMATPSA